MEPRREKLAFLKNNTKEVIIESVWLRIGSESQELIRESDSMCKESDDQTRKEECEEKKFVEV
eukprot:snap_masked-scaffold_64-processed-gene-0.43-mRNA-1 protein AED:1.00 eAED:1.00 QI:0/-1/0/0/-1/1/1/0/62